MKTLRNTVAGTILPVLVCIGCEAPPADNTTLGLGDPTTDAITGQKAEVTLENIVNRLKESLTPINDNMVYGLMVRHYQTMRLMDSNGNWVDGAFELISEDLLPSDITVSDIYALIDETAVVAANNDYLMYFLEQVADEPLDRLNQKLETEGAQILPAVLTYAMVQELLTTAMHNDWRLIEVCKNIFVSTRDELGIMKALDPFYLVKLMSVEGPMLDYIKYHTAGEVPADFMKLELPLNIMEAVGTDIGRDNDENARAGIVLGFNKPGLQPARFSDAGTSILLSMPEPKLWADLYAIWNLGFTAHYGHFPFTMVKLLIPRVNDYEALPEEYIYNRSLALYTHLHFTFFGQYDLVRKQKSGMDWFDASLWQTFAKANRQSARIYDGVVAGH